MFPLVSNKCKADLQLEKHKSINEIFRLFVFPGEILESIHNSRLVQKDIDELYCIISLLFLYDVNFLRRKDVFLQIMPNPVLSGEDLYSSPIKVIAP